MIVILTTFDKNKLDSWMAALDKMDADYHWGTDVSIGHYKLEVDEADAELCGIENDLEAEQRSDDMPQADDDGLPF